ncbi:PAS domain-containing protein [Croceibacterium sp. TMG7-5b_MA50]|uniref:PAS domain-containing protein n=1 Tax=Croceibacterium sp. TMG7-5b_MA50 TaxID=3121290 RepID=UPI003221F91E
MNDKERGPDGQRIGQAYDEAPNAFLRDHPEDQFSAASGVLFEQAMAQTRMAICLSDPRQPDCPIIFANRAFRTLTGYEQEEILGRNCRFLQGPKTSRAAVARIRDALQREDVVVVELLNYRKGGETFWNALHIGPIYDHEDNLLYYFGSQWDVTDVHAARAHEQHARMVNRELSHRMKNMFSVISAIVNIVGRSNNSADVAHSINERIHALGRAYETTLDTTGDDAIPLHAAVGNILSTYRGDTDRITIDGEELSVPFSLLSAVGLMLHELAANAIKYGAFSNETGTIAVNWHQTKQDDGQTLLVMDWEESGGPPLSGPPESSGTGTVLLDRIIRTYGGAMHRDWRADGLAARITVPLR